ncbi:MAG TPA: ROK family protein [Verrucomicrobiae bacterium]|nr:ROK family protein [Verrucomicrobiae bacterium]
MRKIDLNNFQVATSETARDINSRIMLNLVRKHQPISRADLMRYSGLQRSTVSVITEQLISERWLREGDTGQLPRGRRPTFLHLNEDRAGFFGINVRPFTTNMALANLTGDFVIQEAMPTPSNADQFVEHVSRRIRELMAEYPQMSYEGIGVSLPGRVDLSSQKFVFAPNLGWREEDLKERLEAAAGLPVDLENEANACALSEYWFGHHSDGARNLIAVAVSEGIGVGMILNGQIVRGPSGLAGEFGHVALTEGGPACACGNQGCWEVYASNSAAVRYYLESKSRPARKNGAGTSFEDVLEFAEKGDLRALAALDRMGHYLGVGIAMLLTGLAPDVIVVVGEVTRAWDRIEPIISEVVKKRSFTHATTRIIASGPAPQPRLRGIIALVLQKHFGAPAIA